MRCVPDILVLPCNEPGCWHLISVDDFNDPDEIEIGRDEIHLTVRRETDDGGEEPVYCTKLDTAGARELIRQLSNAVAGREYGASWCPRRPTNPHWREVQPLQCGSFLGLVLLFCNVLTHFNTNLHVLFGAT